MNNFVFVFQQMVIELSSGPFLAIEVASKCEDKHPCHAFRELCGPADPVRSNISLDESIFLKNTFQ